MSAAMNAFGRMSDSELRQAITQLSSAAATPTPPPRTTRPSRAAQRAAAATAAATSATTTATVPTTTAVAAAATNPVYFHQQSSTTRPPIQPTQQATQSTYASRLRTGATLLVQPIVAAPSSSLTTTRSSRRGAVVNYADPGSGDDLPDAGALDSDDSDFVASGGTRTSIRQQRGSRSMNAGMGVFHSQTGATMSPHPHPQQPVIQAKPEKAELDQSYLGAVPPAKFITARFIGPTAHVYPSPEAVERQAQRKTALVPVRVEFETDTHRIRDCFVWNVYEENIKPETFAKIFCSDLDLPIVPWAETVANQIKAQLEDSQGIATMELGLDSAIDASVLEQGEEVAECRVILSIDVQIANHHLMDHIEWDLLSPLTPEAFASKLCTDLGLSGEAIPLVAHAVHEELIKHKKDAVEWGVIGAPPPPSDPQRASSTYPDEAGGDSTTTAVPKRDRSGLSLVKDKTGLGLGWGRAPRDGRLPKALKSVWRDWAEAEEFRTRFEVLTAEEVERREIEKERASRRLRRETSKFQSQALGRVRRR